MRLLVPITIATLSLVACAGGPPPESPADETDAAQDGAASSGDDAAAASGEAGEAGDSSDPNQFNLADSDSAGSARGVEESKIKPSATEAAMRFIVVDKDKGPIEGVVISMTAPDGKKYYTGETDAKGYAEVLVPVGKKYDLVYLSLAKRDIAASVPVSDEPNQNIKLTLRYKGYEKKKEPVFILKGVEFDTGKATIRPESFPHLDSVVEYMQYKKSSRIEISGHTDNVGNKKSNKKLSEARANACRDYLIKKGIDGSRIKAVGFGDERPIAPNTNDEGRQKNRRIEAKEL